MCNRHLGFKRKCNTLHLQLLMCRLRRYGIFYWRIVVFTTCLLAVLATEIGSVELTVAVVGGWATVMLSCAVEMPTTSLCLTTVLHRMI